jgi:hypothetical protein
MAFAVEADSDAHRFAVEADSDAHRWDARRTLVGAAGRLARG